MTSKTLCVALPCVIAALLLQVDPTAAGATYIRWGRTVCPSGADFLFKGYIAGTFYNFTGGSSSLLCAHEDPQWGKNDVPGVQIYSGQLSGAEYELSGGYDNSRPFDSTNARGANLHDRDAVCAACHVPSGISTIVITGRQDCGDSKELTLQYAGYLMSSATWQNHHRTDTICVDEAPQARVGTEVSLNGAVLYPVQAKCGSLPCPAYKEGSEITCAVCTA